MCEESSNLIERARLSKQHELGLLALEVLLKPSQHLEVIVEFEREEVLGFLLGKAQIHAIDDSEAHSLNELVDFVLGERALSFKRTRCVGRVQEHRTSLDMSDVREEHVDSLLSRDLTFTVMN